MDEQDGTAAPRAATRRPKASAASAGLAAATRRRQWMLVGLLFAAGCVNYLDRSTLAVANRDIAAEMHLSPAAMGTLLSAFAWSYAVCQIPAGVLTDRLGPRVMILAGMTGWSLAQIASGAMRGFGAFLAARIALGIGEAPMFTGGARAIVAWFPVRERGLPLGLTNAASSLGPAVAPPVLTALMLAFGWRPMFMLMGVAGLAVAIAWGLLYREPGQSPIPTADRATLEVGTADQARADTIGHLLRRPSTWALMGGAFGTVYVTWLYATWLPAYLETVRHLDTARTGWLAAVPQLAGFAGACLGGALSDRLVARGMAPVLSRKAPAGAGLIIAAVFAAAGPFSPSVATDLACMSGALFFAYAAGSCGWALGATLAPPGAVATLEAIQNIGGSVGGGLAPFVTGLLAERPHGYTAAFAVAAAVAVVSGVSYGLCGRETDLLPVAEDDDTSRGPTKAQ